MINYNNLRKQLEENKPKNQYISQIYSRFYITPKIRYDDKIIWNIFSWMKYNFYIKNYKYHTVKENERLDLISYKYYESVKYWWIIALFNADSSLDPYDLEQPGFKLRIPDKNEIITFMDEYSINQTKIFDKEENITY